VLFDKIGSVCFVSEIYVFFSTENDQPGEPTLCQLNRHTFVSYIAHEARIALIDWSTLKSYARSNASTSCCAGAEAADAVVNSNELIITNTTSIFALPDPL